MDTVLWLCPSLPTETLKWLSSLPILMQKSFWWWQCSDRYIISVSPHLHTPFPPFSPSLISHPVSVDLKHHVYLLMAVKKKKKKLPTWVTCFQCLHTVQGPGCAAKCRQAGSRHGSASSRLHCGQQVSCQWPQPVLLQERGRWSVSWKKNKKGLVVVVVAEKQWLTFLCRLEMFWGMVCFLKKERKRSGCNCSW